MEDTKKKMIWSRLKSMKCPRCSKDISQGIDSTYACAGNCGFRIGKGKFDTVITSLYMRHGS